MVRLRPATAAAAFVPLSMVAVDPWGLAPFGPVKGLVVATGVLVVTALVVRAGVAVDRRVTALFAGFVGWMAVTAAAGLDPLYAWIGTPERHWGWLTWLLALLAFIAGQSLRSGAPLRRSAPLERDRGGIRRGPAPESAIDALTLQGGAAVAAGAAGAWALAEWVGWEPFPVTAAARPGGPFGSSAYLGAALALLVPVLLAALVRRWRWPVALAFALGIGGLVASGARAAWVGTAVGSAAVLWPVVAPGAGQRARERWGITVLALLLAVVAAPRLGQLVTDEYGGVRGRVDEWRVASRVVADRPVTGTGPEGYRLAFGAAVDDAYEMEHGRDPLPDRAHSSLLDVAATGGLPGLALYAALLALVLLRARPSLLFGALLAWQVAALFLFPVFEVDLAGWLLAGAAMPAPQPWRLPRFTALVPTVLAVVTFAAGALDVAADHAARSELDGTARPGRAAGLRPDAIRYRLAAARAHEDRGSIDAALAAVDRGLDISPLDPVLIRERTRLLLDRARATRSEADITAARDGLAAAVDDDPRNAALLLRLGVAHALAGDDRAAEKAWLEAERLAPRSGAASANLAVAYARAGDAARARAAADRALVRDPGNATARRVLAELEGTE